MRGRSSQLPLRRLPLRATCAIQPAAISETTARKRDPRASRRSPDPPRARRLRPRCAAARSATTTIDVACLRALRTQQVRETPAGEQRRVRGRVAAERHTAARCVLRQAKTT
jgi:hypothetical protein